MARCRWPCCVNCHCSQSLIFLDSFTGSYRPEWTISPDHPTANFAAVGNRLRCEAPGPAPSDATTLDDGAMYISVSRPALNGLSMCVKAQCFSLPKTSNPTEIRTSTVGIWIGGCVVFFGRPRLNPGSPVDAYGRSNVDENGDVTGGSVTFDGTFGDEPGDSSIMSLSIVDTSGGAGLYRVSMCIEHDSVVELIRQEEDVAFTITDPLLVGVACTDSAEWDNFRFQSNV